MLHTLERLRYNFCYFGFEMQLMCFDGTRERRRSIK